VRWHHLGRLYRPLARQGRVLAFYKISMKKIWNGNFIEFHLLGANDRALRRFRGLSVLRLLSESFNYLKMRWCGTGCLTGLAAVSLALCVGFFQHSGVGWESMLEISVLLASGSQRIS
jgi:hypothetical protein